MHLNEIAAFEAEASRAIAFKSNVYGIVLIDKISVHVIPAKAGI